MHAELSAARLERLANKAGGVLVVMPDDDYAHPQLPRLPRGRSVPAGACASDWPPRGRSFGAKLSCMAPFPAVDLTDLDMWARGVPYEEFARLRCEAPAAWSGEPGGGPGFWSVTRYDDIVTASRDTRTFSSSRGVSFEEPTDEDMAARRTIIDTDPPAHTKLRKILS